MSIDVIGNEVTDIFISLEPCSAKASDMNRISATRTLRKLGQTKLALIATATPRLAVNVRSYLTFGKYRTITAKQEIAKI